MNTKEIIDLIENFAPLETQESWDCSGWQIDFGKAEVKKILLCVSVTQKIIEQAAEKNCDLIIAHHPLFFVPFDFKKNVSVYSAHTNLDKAKGGTTDTLIEVLNLQNPQPIGDFLRLIELENEIPLEDFISLIKKQLNLNNIRVVNNKNKQNIKKLAFCAGSGMDFLSLAEENSADIFITGDVKYHSALDCGIIITDAGHFESEHPVLNTIKNLLTHRGIEVIIADEKSPFINY